MDDLLIITRTRRQLRRAVAIMNRWFATAGLQQHLDTGFGATDYARPWVVRMLVAIDIPYPIAPPLVL